MARIRLGDQGKRAQQNLTQTKPIACQTAKTLVHLGDLFPTQHCYQRTTELSREF